MDSSCSVGVVVAVCVENAEESRKRGDSKGEGVIRLCILPHVLQLHGNIKFQVAEPLMYVYRTLSPQQAVSYRLYPAVG